MSAKLTRRDALRSSLSLAGVAAFADLQQRAHGFVSANERPRVGAIGTGSRWCLKATGIDGPWGSAPDMRKYGDYVALCDADSQRLDKAAELVHEWSGIEATQHRDYRAVIDNPKIVTFPDKNSALAALAADDDKLDAVVTSLAHARGTISNGSPVRES